MSDRSAPTVWVKKFYARERVVTLRDGARARIHIDDSGTVQHTETDDRLDALVRPLRTVRVTVRRDDAAPLLTRLRQQGHRP